MSTSNQIPALSKPHLRLTCPIEFPDNTVVAFIGALTHSGLRVEIDRQRTAGIRTKGAPGIEWLAPTAVIAYLSKPYFEEFLKEAGKDHYRLLKIGLKNLWKWLFGRTSSPSPEIQAADTIEAVRPHSLYSGMLSVVVELDASLTMKLLIRKTISENMFATQIDKFVLELERLKSGDPESSLRRLIDEAHPLGSQILVAYDAYTEDFVVIDAALSLAENYKVPASRTGLRSVTQSGKGYSQATLLQEKLSMIVTFASSQPTLMGFLKKDVLGDGRDVAKSIVDFSEVQARHALIELAWTIRMIDEAENLDRLLGEEATGRCYGIVFLRDGSRDTVNLRAILDKIVSADRIHWRDHAALNSVIVCMASPSDLWLETIVDLRALEWVCDQFNGFANEKPPSDRE